jgi:hypothetical protein
MDINKNKMNPNNRGNQKTKIIQTMKTAYKPKNDRKHV